MLTYIVQKCCKVFDDDNIDETSSFDWTKGQIRHWEAALFVQCEAFMTKTLSPAFINKLLKSGHPESNQGPSDHCMNLQSDALPTELWPAWKQCRVMSANLPRSWNQLIPSVASWSCAREEELNLCMSPCPMSWSHVQAPAWLTPALGCFF